MDPSESMGSTLAPVAGQNRVGPVLPLTGSDRYQVNEEIGRGGMGRVLGATDLQFGRKVAIKEMLQRSSTEGTRRFEAEARITASLAHPGIPSVHERGVHADGTPFYVMEHVAGRTMGTLLRGSASLEQRLRLLPILTRVAQTIAYAHDQGVIHRDIKPDNIIVGDYGEAFVLDWGVAKSKDTRDPSTGPQTQPGPDQTQVGAVMGTPAFMSPEQARGDATLDARSDVFALGAILYNLLSGRAPYDGATVTEVLANARKGEFRSLGQAAPRASSLLRGICERAMAVNPADRFHNARELAEALEGFQADQISRASSAVSWFTNVLQLAAVIGVLFSSAVVLHLLPTFEEQGPFGIVSLCLGIAGIVLGLLEFSTRGRHGLQPLVLGFAAATVLVGLAGSTAEFIAVCDFLLGNQGKGPGFTDSFEFQKTFVRGSREAIGNVPLSCMFGAAQILIWAAGRRRIQKTGKVTA